MGAGERWGPWLATTLLGFGLGAAGCAYAPQRIDCDRPLPADAFARCERLLGARYGGLTEVDPAAFRIRTAWLPVAEPPGERRAALFRTEHGLAVVVEARWLVEPWFGLPGWSEVAGDPTAEAELVKALRRVLGLPDQDS